MNKLPAKPIKGDYVEFTEGLMINSGRVVYVFEHHIVIDSDHEPAYLMERSKDYRELVYTTA